MDFPNLFLIDKSFPDNNFTIIGMDNNVAVLTSDDMGCFKGDCFCCAEDGSSKPKASMVYSSGSFTYSSEGSKISKLYRTRISFGLYNEVILESEGDINGSISVNGEVASNIFSDGCGFIFSICASNECGTSCDEDFCHCISCYAGYGIDCERQKITITKRVSYEDAKHPDSQIITEYYDLGNVPDIDYYKSNGCGLPCHIQEKAACIFNKTALVLEYSNFADISEEYFEETPGYATQYYKMVTSGIGQVNGTYVFPLYVRRCEDYNILDPQGTSGQYIGYSREIAYDRPKEILLGQLKTIVDYELKLYRLFEFGTFRYTTVRKHHMEIIDDIILTRDNGIGLYFSSMTAEWYDESLPPYSGNETNIPYMTPSLPLFPLGSLGVLCETETLTDWRIGGVNLFGTYIPYKIGKFKGYYANM